MMVTSQMDAVTGAFGYSGKYITRILLARGEKVRNLTRHSNKDNPFGNEVTVVPFDFSNQKELADSLRGVTTLFNTYWVRFPHGQFTFEKAIANTKILIQACREAGVHKIVHISVTNPSENSPFPYFKGKALIEKAIMESGLSYIIVRPALIFGKEDVLINNIAWLLRRFPIFVIPGSGDYRLRPIFAEDLAQLMVSAGQQAENTVINAVGPELYTFDQLVRLIARSVNSKARIIHLPPDIALLLSRFIGKAIGDVLLTKEEVGGLMANLLDVDVPATGSVRLSDWLEQNGQTVGLTYASELRRHFSPVLHY